MFWCQSVTVKDMLECQCCVHVFTHHTNVSLDYIRVMWERPPVLLFLRTHLWKGQQNDSDSPFTSEKSIFNSFSLVLWGTTAVYLIICCAAVLCVIWRSLLCHREAPTLTKQSKTHILKWSSVACCRCWTLARVWLSQMSLQRRRRRAVCGGSSCPQAPWRAPCPVQGRLRWTGWRCSCRCVRAFTKAFHIPSVVC